MKTVTIAFWYVSVAMGNFLVIIVIQARFFRSQVFIHFYSFLELISLINIKNLIKIIQANEFFLFAGLILLDMLIFAAMVRKYKFVLMEADSSETPFSVLVNPEQEDYSSLINVGNSKRLTHDYSITSSSSSISTSLTSDS